jgi:hypothetical protein
MTVIPDLYSPPDLEGVDLYGVLNCKALNDCTRNCGNTMCVAACRQRATPTAQTLEYNLQQCFFQYCPQQSDMATPTCAVLTSASCTTCIFNTQQADTSTCNPAGAPECRMCYAQSQACLMDM